MSRPTKEQLAEIRDSHERDDRHDGAWCRMAVVLAEVDALTENPPHIGEVTRRAIAERNEAIARADAAERERDEARAVVARIAARDTSTPIGNGDMADAGWVLMERQAAAEQRAIKAEAALVRLREACVLVRDALSADHDPAVRLPVLPETCGECEHWSDGCYRCGGIPFAVTLAEPTRCHARPPTWCPLRKEG